jgi:pimeloyl-ACP methyl ester carboxylesterase
VESKIQTVVTLQPDPIEEGMFVEIHGVPQWITLRGHNRRNPVLLILTGPGAAFSRMAPFFAPWEDAFTLVQWDQPGSGTTQAKNGDEGTSPLTFDRLAEDAIAVVEFARKRLATEKVAILGISAGSVIGLRIAKERPDLFSAYIGTGQTVTWLRQEALGYSLVLEQARSANNQEAVAELESIGAPPYQNAATDAIKSKYCAALTPAEQTYLASLDPAIMAAVRNPPANASWIAPGVPVSDLRAHAMSAYEKIRAELFTFDAYELGLRFDVPMFFLQGALDTYAVTSEVESYTANIQTPQKLFAPIPGGGHSAFFLRDTFLALLLAHVRSVIVASKSAENE